MAVRNLNIELSEREKAILQTIVQLYILRAMPIGSRFLSKHLADELNLSPASIRNIMADLEDMDFICHPHTSAGRVPTDKGYRFYVDSLEKIEYLTEPEIHTLQSNLIPGSSTSVLRDASKLLGMLSKYLSIVEFPHLKELKVIKVDLIELSSTRLLVVIALDSDNIRTVTLETDFEIDYKHLPLITSYINEKVSGKPLNLIRENFKELISEFNYKDIPLIRMFVESVDKIFEYHGREDKLLIAGTQNLLSYPEFEDVDKVRSVIEIIENEDVIIHLLDKYDDSNNDIRILIGKEMQNDLLEDYSLVVSSYKFGSATGSIGLIGPKRMNYSKMRTLVQHVSQTLSQSF